MRFANRSQAGELLARELDSYKGTDSVVYALPRGGVILGVKIARYLNVPLDLITSRKVGHPNWEEYAICAVTEDGEPVCNQDEVESVDKVWLEKAIAKQRDEARRRRKLYLAGRKLIDIKNKIAIVTDDGIATGLTMMAAINEIKDKGPSRIVVAIPVSPPEIVVKLQRDYGVEVVALDSGEGYLGSVGIYYDNFEQITDEEVINLMKV